MKLCPVHAKGIQVGFSIEAESDSDYALINILTSRGDHWKGFQIEEGKLLVYPDPNQTASGATIH
jgi:hypothetical protein